MDSKIFSFIPTQFSVIGFGGLGDFRYMFSLYNKGWYSFELMVGYKITLGPASRRISATCMVITVRIAVQRWNFDIPTSSR